MGHLTTHILDTARGKPAAGLKIELFYINGDTEQHIISATTNDDGRCDAPLLEGDGFKKGRYKLIFCCTDYLRENGDNLPEIPFLDDVIIAFGIDDQTQHYHVPLLLSAYGYSTYRGS